MPRSFAQHNNRLCGSVAGLGPPAPARSDTRAGKPSSPETNCWMPSSIPDNGFHRCLRCSRSAQLA